MDLDKLLTVLLSASTAALVSLAVEYVKTRRATDLWLAQERWKLKRETYAGLLGTLAEIRRRAEQFTNVQAGLVGPTNALQDRFFEQTAERLGELRVSLDRLTAVATLWLGPGALRTLADLERALTPPPPGLGRADGTEAVSLVAERASIALLETARGDFRL